MSLTAQTSPLIGALEQLGPRDHFCSIYESPEEHYAVAIPFIRIGLERGEKWIYIGGRGPGLVATVLAVFCLDYFIFPPAFTLSLDKSQASNLIVFGAFSLFLSWASANRKNAQERLRVLHGNLEQEVRKRTEELETANIKLQTEIVERRKAELSLREHASLLNLTHDTIFVRDMDDVITYWNRGAEELYGRNAEEVVGKFTSHQLMQTVFPAPLDEINAEVLSTSRLRKGVYMGVQAAEHHVVSVGGEL